MEYLTQFLIIISVTLAGEALQWLIPLPIPASVYGLALLFAALCLKIVKVHQVKKTGGFLTSLLPMLFVATTVGIAEQWDLIKSRIAAILVLLVFSTVLTFAISGRVTQWIIGKGGKANG